MDFEEVVIRDHGDSKLVLVHPKSADGVIERRVSEVFVSGLSIQFSGTEVTLSASEFSGGKSARATQLDVRFGGLTGRSHKDIPDSVPSRDCYITVESDGAADATIQLDQV